MEKLLGGKGNILVVELLPCLCGIVAQRQRRLVHENEYDTEGEKQKASNSPWI